MRYCTVDALVVGAAQRQLRNRDSQSWYSDSAKMVEALLSFARLHNRASAPSVMSEIQDSMDIGTVMNRVYESEINCSISSVWDGGWDVKLGDYMNGFVAEGNFRTLNEAAEFLDRAARKQFPRSVYALADAHG